MKPGTATLTAQDATAVRAIIAQMETQIFDLNRLVSEGYTSPAGISCTVSDVADRIADAYSYHPTTYRPLSGLKSERWDDDGNSATVGGDDVRTAEEHLDAIITELYDGTYPGFTPAHTPTPKDEEAREDFYTERIPNYDKDGDPFHDDGDASEYERGFNDD